MRTRREADLFARLLDEPAGTTAGQDVGGLTELVALAHELPRPQVTPDPQFVARLREQLVTAAEQQAASRPRAATAAQQPAGQRPGPRTLVIRRPRGVLPVAVATLLGLAVLIGGLSTRALPGDRLYEVKLSIGQAQVRLAGSDQARAKALLHQVDARLDEVDALVSSGDPNPADVDTALNQAARDLARAQRLLLSGSDAHADPASLQLLADATAQASGRLGALAPMLPTASGGAVQRLQDLLAVGNAAVHRQAQACGAPCAVVRQQVESRLGSSGGTSSSGGAPSSSVPGSSVPGSAGSRAGVPGSGPASGSTTPAGRPAGSGVVPGAGSAGHGAGHSASLPGATVSAPGLSVTLSGPHITVPPHGRPTVSVPTARVTLGPATVSVSTSGCVVGVNGLCVGPPRH